MSGNRGVMRKWLEFPSWFAGSALVGWYLYSLFNASAFQHRTQRELANATAAETTIALQRGDAVGRLEIPRLDLSVMVVSGDDDGILSVAAGHLRDTPLPWQPGNTAIAGHRDTFFRPLKQIRVDDDVRLVTPHGTFNYRVRDISVVEPTDVSVLTASSAPQSLTLLTCYPFAYVGHAPKRYAVHADLVGTAGTVSPVLVAGLLPRIPNPPRIPRPPRIPAPPPVPHVVAALKTLKPPPRPATPARLARPPRPAPIVKPAKPKATRAATSRRVVPRPPAPRLRSANRG